MLGHNSIKVTNGFHNTYISSGIWHGKRSCYLVNYEQFKVRIKAMYNKSEIVLLQVSLIGVTQLCLMQEIWVYLNSHNSDVRESTQLWLQLQIVIQ